MAKCPVSTRAHISTGGEPGRSQVPGRGVEPRRSDRARHCAAGPACAGASPHQLRHAHALELLREGVPLNVVQPQLGHRNLGVTSIHLQGIDPAEIIDTVHARRRPMIPASMGLALPRIR